MFCLLTLLLLLTGLASTALGAGAASADKVPSTRDFGDIRREVETLRGKKFKRTVPVFKVSDNELRAISDRGLEKDYPGAKLQGYQELLAWLDMIRPTTDLKSAFATLSVAQIAGLYDSDTKEMCIPTVSLGNTNATKRPAEKKVHAVSPDADDIVMAHEFTHALEDQYWPLDDPMDNDTKRSTDRGTAHDFVAEGSATREMLEAVPAQSADGSPKRYFFLWNLLHSGAGEFVLNAALSHAWKGQDVLVNGVPNYLARTEVMPYSFGYTFCADMMRKWGLDGLDYVYDHPAISSAQVMHPKKYWEWREFPVQIDLPQTLPGGWKQISIDSEGEAGIAALFGCQFDYLNKGLALARGWDGDHVALYADPGKHRFLLWASSWDSADAAARYAGACVKERQLAHQAEITLGQPDSDRVDWNRPDGRVGFIVRDGKRVIMVETNKRKALRDADAYLNSVTFTEPHEKTVRLAENSPFRRFNPLWSRQKDGDYILTRSACGLLSRHDRNSVGASDRYVLGLLAESRRTIHFRKWELGGGLLARHESEARRGFSKTTLLPWGVLASHCSARLPQSPDKTITRTSIVWGLAESSTMDAKDTRRVRVLPFGLLFRRTSCPGQTSVHVLGTGRFHREATGKSGAINRFRLLGIPIWTTHSAAHSEI